ncbi:hypothetical protein ACWCSD_13455 [Nonomuraea sp. NPDC001684]
MNGPRTRNALPALCLSAALTACGTQWFPHRLQADPAALAQVREIGRTVRQEQAELAHDGTIQVEDIVVLDLGAATFEEALRLAHDRLRRRGWQDDADGPDRLGMSSPAWKQASLTVGSLWSAGTHRMQADAYAGRLKSDAVVVVRLCETA